MGQEEGLVWGALACCLVWGAIYCLYLLWRGQAKGRHMLLLATCCFFLPKMPTLMARGETSHGEGLTYSGLVSWGRYNQSNLGSYMFLAGHN